MLEGMAVIPELTQGNHADILKAWKAIKAERPEFVLFFREGGDVRLFEDDARLLAGLSVADYPVALMTKGGLTWCGFPERFLERRIGLLLKAGKRVAVLDRVEAQ